MKARVWFEAQGQRAAAMGLSLLDGRVARYAWPEFAQRAYVRGYLNAFRRSP